MLQLINSNAVRIPLAAKSVHVVATSPPYWSLRDYGVPGQLGLEPLHDCLGWARGENCGACYVCVTRLWAAEVWRVLRDDGVAWINLGDSFANSSTKNNNGTGASTMGWIGQDKSTLNKAEGTIVQSKLAGSLKPKDLCMIPARVALALQADGWYLRDNVAWVKAWQDASGVLEGSTMPGSQRDRFTSAWEHVFLLTKKSRYFFDIEAVKTTSGATMRNVFRINPAPFSGSHFACYPPALVEPCIKAGTSERGCCRNCGAQFERIVERESKSEPYEYLEIGIPGECKNRGRRPGAMGSGLPTKDVGWRPTCQCNAGEPVPAVVLDPFAGSGTTLMVARKLGRRAVGLDLSMQYLTECARPRLALDKLDAWHNGGDEQVANLEGLPMFGGIE